MKAFDQVYQYVKPYRGRIVLSLLILALSAAADFLIITLVIPLFDQVLTSQPDASMQSLGKFAFLIKGICI
jgi:ABC-type multidrug transport system fused ATPase/permease subunit